MNNSEVKSVFFRSDAARSLAFWLVVTTLGYLYVSGVLLRHPRANPFASPEGHSWELGKLLLVSLVFWAIGARKTLVTLASPWKNAVVQNGLFWVIPFFVGLHFYFIQGLRISLTPAGLGRIPFFSWVILFFAAVVVTALLGYHAWLAKRAGILRVWLASLAAVVVTISVITFCIRETHYVHIHHYFLFGVLVPWLRFPNRVSMICQGLAAGIGVEGVTTWGMDPMWYPLG